MSRRAKAAAKIAANVASYLGEKEHNQSYSPPLRELHSYNSKNYPHLAGVPAFEQRLPVRSYREKKVRPPKGEKDYWEWAAETAMNPNYEEEPELRGGSKRRTRRGQRVRGPKRRRTTRRHR